jgi:hypothetical protein
MCTCSSAVLLSCRLVNITDVNEQEICIKLRFKPGKTAVETHTSRMLKEVFDDSADV